MPTAPRLADTDANDLPADIAELTIIVGGLPPESRTRLEPILARVVESTKRRRRILSLVQDALSQLRLDMKYLVFDLEATRRERDEYRGRLEGTGEEGSGSERDRLEPDDDDPSL
jgi:hypothetical protein